MSRLKRYHSNTDTCFITSVTYNRLPILIEYIDPFKESINKYQKELDFKIGALVVLPDHWHILIEPKGNNISDILRLIKLSFSKKFRFLQGSSSGQVWQKRFFDHIIRSRKDLNIHIDYIHFNPVKHGLVRNSKEWRYSTFTKYLNNGYYSADWGLKESPKFIGNFGE